MQTGLSPNATAPGANASLALKAPLASPTFTGSVTVPDATAVAQAASLGQLHQRGVSVKFYGVAGDCTSVTGNTSITSGASALTVAGAAFTSADVGKAIVVPGAGAAGAVLSTTIAARVSATQVTLTATAGTTLSAVSKTVFYGTDDTVALQLAIDTLAATTQIGGAVTVPDLIFPPGDYYLSAAITKKGSRWIGSGVDNTRLIWNGDTSTDMVTQSTTARGSNSAGGISQMSFISGVAKPQDMLVIPANSNPFGVDNNYKVERVRFSGATRYCINLSGGFVNCHFNDLRFDKWNSFAICITPYTNQTSGSFNLENWTADHMSGSTGEGFLLIDNTAALTFIGGIRLANARYENNASWTGRKGFIVMVTGGISDFCHLQLQNIAYQDVGNVTSSDCLIYLDGTAASAWMTATGITLNSMSAIIGGTPPTDWPTPPIINYNLLAMNRQGMVAYPLHSAGTHRVLELYPRDVAGAQALAVWRGTETSPRLQISADGTILTGTGSATATKVLSTRDTGWTAMTGSAIKTTIAAAAAGTASGTYVSSELQGALTRIAALEARMKGYDAALIAHGLIGA